MSSEVGQLPPDTRKTLPESPIVSAYGRAYSTSLDRYVHDTPSPDTDYEARGLMNVEVESRRHPWSVGDVAEKEETLNVNGSLDSVGDTSVREPAIKYEDCTGAVYRIRKGIDRTPLQVSRHERERANSGHICCLKKCSTLVFRSDLSPTV